MVRGVDLFINAVSAADTAIWCCLQIHTKGSCLTLLKQLVCGQGQGVAVEFSRKGLMYKRFTAKGQRPVLQNMNILDNPMINKRQVSSLSSLPSSR